MYGFFALSIVSSLIAGAQLWPPVDDGTSTVAAAIDQHCTGCDPAAVTDRYKTGGGRRDVSEGPQRDGPPRRPLTDGPRHGGRRPLVDRAVYGGAEKTAAVGTTQQRAVHHRGQSKITLNKIEKLILIAMNMFLDKMEMAGHVAALKLKLIYKMLIKPLMKSL